MVKRAMYNHSIAAPGGCTLKSCTSTSKKKGCCGNRLYSTIDWVGAKSNRGRTDEEFTNAMLTGKIWDGKKVEGDLDVKTGHDGKPWTDVIDRESALSRLASIQSQRGGKGGPSHRTSPNTSPSAGVRPVNGGAGGQQPVPRPAATPAGFGAHVWTDVEGHVGNSLNGDGGVAAEIDRLTNQHGAAANSGVDLAADELLRLSEDVMRSVLSCQEPEQRNLRRPMTIPQALSTRDQVEVVPQVPQGGLQ